MNFAHDIFAETNPAFVACALNSFTTSYSTAYAAGPEIPLAYLAIPIALSGDLNETFSRTNKNTGLADWLERSPQIQVGLAERINGSLGVVTDAIRLGCFSRLLMVADGARLQPGARALKRRLSRSHQPFKSAERLGYWFAAVGSTKTVFDIMGLTA